MPRRVAILCEERTLLSSAATHYDAFQLINGYVQRRSVTRDTVAIAPPTDVALLSLRGGPVRPAGGMATLHTEVLDMSRPFDIVVLPSLDTGAERDVDAIVAGSEFVQSWLRAQHCAGAYIGASGPAVAILAASGLLDERPAAISWWMQRSFRRRFRRVAIDMDAPVVQSDALLTCNGAASDLPLALRLITDAVSPNTASWLSKISSAAREGLPLELGGGPPQEGYADPLVTKAKFWIDENLARPIAMRELVAELFVSERTLVRRFKRSTGMTPHAYLQYLRVEVAKLMLIRTNRSVARIAGLVGYSDTRHFRAIFEQRTGCTPGAFRKAALRRAAEPHPWIAAEMRAFPDLAPG